MRLRPHPRGQPPVHGGASGPRAGGIAGTSAGLAVQGEFTHDACADSVRSVDALADPYDRRVRLVDGPFQWPFARGLVADPHFVARDRMGRAMAFVARQVQDGRALPATALAVDEGTALILDRRSRGAVLGTSAAYVVRATMFRRSAGRAGRSPTRISRCGRSPPGEPWICRGWTRGTTR